MANETRETINPTGVNAVLIDQSRKVHIRWMIRRDMPEVLAIESASFGYPWGEEDFLRVLRRRNCIGMVAERGERVVGYMVYELDKASLALLNLAVDPRFRRTGVGRQLIDKLVGKLSHHRRTRVDLWCRETSMDALLFLRSSGFLAIEVSRGYYEDGGEDAYLMTYQLDPE